MPTPYNPRNSMNGGAPAPKTVAGDRREAGIYRGVTPGTKWSNQVRNANQVGTPDSIERQEQYRNGTAKNETQAPTYHGKTLNANDLEYNVGMVLSGYHMNRFEKLTGQSSDLPKTVAGGSVANQFSEQGLYKGMIVTHVFEDANQQARQVPSNSDGGSGVTVEGRYGFQFHYNPTQFGIEYSGQPPVDLGLLAADKDPFNYTGDGVSQSSVSNLNFVINRQADFAYYDPKTKMLKAGVSPSIYGAKKPTAEEQKRIYEYGTMYDIEYLLAAQLGFKQDTKYRGVTSDLGWVAGSPVSLFLGNKVKYVGWINNVSIVHEYFDQRMVPTRSTVAVGFSIIPDMKGSA